MKETVAAWLAGLLDGEGSVMLNKRTFSGNSSATTPMNSNPRYRPVVVLAAGTDYRLMEAIKNRIGVGQIYEHEVSNSSKSYNPRARRQWTYRLNVSQITDILPHLLPWLVLKREQSDLLLEAIRIKKRLTPVKGSGWNTPEIRVPSVERLDEIYQEIRHLNTRGRTAE